MSSKPKKTHSVSLTAFKFSSEKAEQKRISSVMNFFNDNLNNDDFLESAQAGSTQAGSKRVLPPGPLSMETMWWFRKQIKNVHKKPKLILWWITTVWVHFQHPIDGRERRRTTFCEIFEFESSRLNSKTARGSSPALLTNTINSVHLSISNLPANPRIYEFGKHIWILNFLSFSLIRMPSIPCTQFNVNSTPR